MEKDVIKQAFSARLNEALDENQAPPKGKNRQGYVGKLFGLSQRGARKWLEGEGMPSMAQAVLVAKELGVAFEWLMTGQGNKYVPEALSEEAWLLAKLFNRLSPAGRQDLMNYAAFLAERHAAPMEKA